jgi:hypothetical protein
VEERLRVRDGVVVGRRAEGAIVVGMIPKGVGGGDETLAFRLRGC